MNTVQTRTHTQLVYATYVFSLICLALLTAPSKGFAGQSIVALVNDEPISAYDIQQRLKLRMAGDRRVPQILRKKLKDPSTPERFKKFIMKHRPQSKAEVEKLKSRFVRQMRDQVVSSLQKNYKKEVLEELIGERLMLQEAKKLNLIVTDDDVTKQMQRIAGRSKNQKTGKPLSLKEFVSQLKRAGIREKDFRKRLKANLSLQKVVGRKYGRQISIGEQEVDEIIASGDVKDIQKTTEFQLQKVTFALPPKPQQKDLAMRLVEANQIRQQITSCTQTATIVKSFPGAVLQSLGKRTSSQIPQPARMFVTKAEAGQSTPPNVNNGKVEFYTVCSKRTILADQKKRQSIQAKLRSEEMARVRTRYLRDLKQDAFIEYR